MRHKKTKSLLNRFTAWRKATLISLARNLIIHQRIKTTLKKAKSVQPLAENLISLAKRNTLKEKRRVFEILGDHGIVVLLFKEIGPLFKNRLSGYTRIIRLANRRGDNAQMVILELTEIKPETKKPKKIKAAKPEEEKPEAAKKIETKEKVLERPPLEKKKPAKKFLGGIRNIFKKERDAL